MTRVTAYLSLAPVLALLLVPASSDLTLPVYTDVTSRSGIVFRHVSGSPQKNYIFEAKGGGAGVLDYDGDGLLDLYFVNGSTLEDLQNGVVQGNRLYRNNGDGTYTDATERAGVQARGWAMGCAAGDYDNDGDPDIYVLCLNGNILYRNNGDGSFTDVTDESGLKDGRWSTSAGFIDYDRDGDLDVFVSNYIHFELDKLPRRGAHRLCTYRGMDVMCGPRGLEGSPDALYRNNGDGTFTDVTAAAGVAERRPYYGLGVAVADCNNDGWPDIYVANDSCPSYLYINQKDGTFQETGLLSGVALSDDGMEQAGMGIDFGDYDNDGWLDITKTNFYGDYNNLYHNEHNGQFTDMSRPSGMAQVTYPFVSWGTRFVDYDNDGWKDIFVATGHVYPDLIARPIGNERYYTHRLLFRNLGNGTFADVSTKSGSGILQERSSRGVAFGDLDNDGDVDAVVCNLDDSPSLLRNDGGNRNTWILVQLKGTKTNRSGLGSRIRVSDGKLVQTADVATSSSIYSSNDPRTHFGIGAAAHVDIEVRWLSGHTQSFKGVAANRIVTIHEEKGLLQGP